MKPRSIPLSVFVLLAALNAQSADQPEPISISVRVHLVQSAKEPALHTTLTEEDVKRVLPKVNKIWAQANVRIELESIRKTAALDDKPVKKDGTYAWVVASVPKDGLLTNGLNVFYVKELTDNGFYSGATGLIFVKDTPKLAEVPGGVDEPIPRVTSHEIGHALGLQHRQDLTNLMASKTTGFSLNTQEIATARAVALAKFDPPAKTEWKVLCDGKSLKDWESAQFGGDGAINAKDGEIVMEQGTELTGIKWTGAALPKKNYEVAWEGRRIRGSDFFAGMVFPKGDDYCSFVAGGWGGSVVGLSAVDGMYADDNPTTATESFDDNRWYRFRLRVSEKYIQAWINNKRTFSLNTTGKTLSVHPAVAGLKPLGVSCYGTVAGVRNIRIRDLTKEEAAEVPKD